MTQDDFKHLLINLQKKTFILASRKKLNPFLIEEALKFHETNFRITFSSYYDSHVRCIAYAMRYGMKTAWQTWLNLKDLPDFHPFKKIVIIGGGPAFELPVLLYKLKNVVTSLEVTILDTEAKSWLIFSEIHYQMAQEMGISLVINYVEPNDIIDQIDELRPDLIVASNMLNEMDEQQIIKLRIIFAKIPYLVQDLHFSRMNLLLQKFVGVTTNMPFPSLSLPSSFLHLNLYGNFENRKLYFDGKELFRKVLNASREYIPFRSR